MTYCFLLSVKDRNRCLLLSNKILTINELIVMFDSIRRTIERLFNAWENKQFKSLSISKGRGAKKRLIGHENVIEEQLTLHNRNLKMAILYIKEEYSMVERRNKNTLFIKINEKNSQKTRIMNITFAAGAYFDYLEIKQSA